MCVDTAEMTGEWFDAWFWMKIAKKKTTFDKISLEFDQDAYIANNFDYTEKDGGKEGKKEETSMEKIKEDDIRPQQFILKWMYEIS